MKKSIITIFAAVVLAILCEAICYADFMPVSKGDSGDTVLEIQEILKQHGYLSGSADGIYGNGTYEAVAVFQKDNGLEVTGVVGEATYEALKTYTGTKAQKTDETDAEKQAEEQTERELVSNPAAVILESDCDIEITKAGFSTSNGYMNYAIVLHNKSEKEAIEFPTYRFTAKDKDGGILGTGNQVLNIIYPGQDYVWGGFGCEIPETPASVEFEVLSPEDYNIKDVTQLSHPEYKPLEIQNANCREDQFSGYKFLGEVYNPNDYDLSQAGVFVVLKDETGAIVGGEMTFVDNVRAENKAAFEINCFDDISFADYEIYANSWM